MTRYIQRIALLGKERWIGWEVDGVGTDMPGLIVADDLSDAEIAERGVREFRPLPFESFLNMQHVMGSTSASSQLADEDLEFRLDALLVGLERYRNRGFTNVPRAMLVDAFGPQFDDPRVQRRLRDWDNLGCIELIGEEECYLRILTRLA